jgi:hypothetical protein
LLSEFVSFYFPEWRFGKKNGLFTANPLVEPKDILELEQVLLFSLALQKVFVGKAPCKN